MSFNVNTIAHSNLGQVPRQEEKEKKNYAAVKTTPNINQGKGATLVPSALKLLHREKERKNQWGSGGLQAWPETGS
jgi:hypothetical protein